MAGNGTSIQLFDSRSCTGKRSTCNTLTIDVVLGQALMVNFVCLLDLLTRVGPHCNSSTPFAGTASGKVAT